MNHIMDDEKGGEGLRVINGEVQVVIISDSNIDTTSTEAREGSVITDRKFGAQVSGGALHVEIVP